MLVIVSNEKRMNKQLRARFAFVKKKYLDGAVARKARGLTVNLVLSK
jgi:hypothetical protein